MVQGLHGTGKSTHIEQVAARLNWPCVRVNLDGHLSRLDLIGRDAVALRDGKQVTEFQEGILPWACSDPSPSSSTNTTPAPRRHVRHSASPRTRRKAHPARSEQGPLTRIRPSACSPPPTPSAWAISTGCITVCSGSITRRSIAGTSSRPSITSPRTGDRHRRRRGADDPEAGRSSDRWSPWPPDPERFPGRRPVDADVAAHGDHLGREHRDLPRLRRWHSGCRSSTSATKPSGRSSPILQRCFDRN